MFCQRNGNNKNNACLVTTLFPLLVFIYMYLLLHSSTDLVLKKWQQLNDIFTSCLTCFTQLKTELNICISDKLSTIIYGNLLCEQLSKNLRKIIHLKKNQN